MSTEPSPFDQGPKPRSGAEPLRARSEFGLRLGFAIFGVVVGVGFAIWSIISLVRNGEVNPVVVILAIVFLAGAITNVVGVTRARVNDAQLRSGRQDAGDA